MADARWETPKEPTRAQAQAAVFLRRPLIWIVLWLALEALIIKLIAGYLGLGSTFLLLFAKSGIGLFLVVWMTGRAFMRLPRTGFSIAHFEGFGFGLLAGLMLMMPGFVLSIMVLALIAPGIRRTIMTSMTTQPDDGTIVLEPGEWREIEAETPALGPDPPQRP